MVGSALALLTPAMRSGLPNFLSGKDPERTIVREDFFVKREPLVSTLGGCDLVKKQLPDPRREPWRLRDSASKALSRSPNEMCFLLAAVLSIDRGGLTRYDRNATSGDA